MLKQRRQKALTGVRVVDLFAGIGAFHLAFKSYGAQIVWACEWDAEAAAVYEANYHLRPEGDITQIQSKDIPDHEILCAGFPCQPFSISGAMRGFEDSRGTLFFEVARIAKEKQPQIMILENVKNLVVHDNGRTFQVILNTLDEIGYDVAYSVLNAADYGVPQSRERIFIVCFRKDLGITSFTFPEPIKLVKHLDSLLQTDAETKDCVINRNDIRFNGVNEFYTNRPLRLGYVNKGGQGERIYSPKGTAITLSAYGGGAGAKTGLYLVNEKVRKLSPRECARLDGFPDSFKIAQNRNIAYKQFGNSVVIDVIQAIIQAMINQGVTKCLP